MGFIIRREIHGNDRWLEITGNSVWIMYPDARRRLTRVYLGVSPPVAYTFILFESRDATAVGTWRCRVEGGVFLVRRIVHPLAFYSSFRLERDFTVGDFIAQFCTGTGMYGVTEVHFIPIIRNRERFGKNASFISILTRHSHVTESFIMHIKSDLWYARPNFTRIFSVQFKVNFLLKRMLKYIKISFFNYEWLWKHKRLDSDILPNKNDFSKFI